LKKLVKVFHGLNDVTLVFLPLPVRVRLDRRCQHIDGVHCLLHTFIAGVWYVGVVGGVIVFSVNPDYENALPSLCYPKLL
jgi:hypothetical protein